MHGLEAITHVGQRAPDDDAHRIVEVRPLHLELEVDLVDLVVPGVDLGARDAFVDLGNVWSFFVSHQWPFVWVVWEVSTSSTR